ncbi:cytochrome c oxidase assembly protein [Sphingosinithalassobacter sp. LHW66-3]|uniref:cytochrome c oxidase assembly protein n=1 Tax=Sphingosinithalassobacter sp. LHW66-3 TaxID=3424718 RepID=UPI003D6B4551
MAGEGPALRPRAQPWWRGTISLAVAYCGPAPVPAALLARWNDDPWLIAVLGALALLVASRATPHQRLPLGAALAVLVVAFVSPLCALSSALFSARAVHHVLLVAVAAPLAAAALPAARAQGAALPFALATATLWLWHAPQLYTAALQSVGLYWLMQLSLLGTAFWFWRAVFSAGASLPMALFTVAAAIGQMGLLGALLTFAPAPLYPHHFAAPLAYGLSPLQDQQLAGLIMWVPAMLPYTIAAAWIARRAWKGGFPAAAR